MIKEWSNIQQLTKQAQRRAELQGADPVRKNENFKNKKIFFFSCPKDLSTHKLGP